MGSACSDATRLGDELQKAQKQMQQLGKEQAQLQQQETALSQQKKQLTTTINQLQARLEKSRDQYQKTQAQQRQLDQSWQQFSKKSSQVRENLSRRVPAARSWLAERQKALQDFERSSQSLPGSSWGSADSGLASSPSEQPSASSFVEAVPQQMTESEADQILFSMLPFVLKKRIGQLNHMMGKHGEKVAAKILEEHLGVTIMALATAQGVDVYGSQKGNRKFIAAEVKTSITNKPFANLLNRAYGGHIQCSDGWLKAVGITDPNSVDVFGVHINPETESCMIYRRMDRKAENWEPIRGKWFPLTDFNLD